MLRLLASYRKARFVFIDVRDLTPFVETEIRLSYLAFGVDRCVFVTDEIHTVEHWRKIVSATVGDQTILAASLMLLPYPGDSCPVATLAARLGEFLKRIPSGTATIRPEAIAFATSLQSRERTQFLDTELGRLLGSLAIFSMFGFAIGFVNTELAPDPDKRIYPQIGGILGVLVWCMAFVERPFCRGLAGTASGEIRKGARVRSSPNNISLADSKRNIIGRCGCVPFPHYNAKRYDLRCDGCDSRYNGSFDSPKGLRD